MMKIFPNPSQSDYVNLSIHPDLFSGENNNAYVILRNMSGDLVYQQAILSSHPRQKILLNNRFESGMYILELHSP